MKKLMVTIIAFILGCMTSLAQPYAFLFSDGTYAISDNAFAYSERVARLPNFEVVTTQQVLIIEKEAWVFEAEQIFYEGMVTNGFGQPPWTNQTRLSVGMALLNKTMTAPTEEERVMADRWKGILEDVFMGLLEYHNSYRIMYGESPITAIWEYPLNSNIIYSNTIDETYIMFKGSKYLKK